MNSIVDRLLDAYRRELQLYEEILELSSAGVVHAREGRPLSELNEINDRKRELLKRLQELDGSVAAEKQTWRERPTQGPHARELSELLHRLTELLRQILHEEREMDRWITEGAGLTGAGETTALPKRAGETTNEPSNAEAASTPLLPGGDR